MLLGEESVGISVVSCALDVNDMKGVCKSFWVSLGKLNYFRGNNVNCLM